MNNIVQPQFETGLESAGVRRVKLLSCIEHVRSVMMVMMAEDGLLDREGKLEKEHHILERFGIPDLDSDALDIVFAAAHRWLAGPVISIPVPSPGECPNCAPEGVSQRFIFTVCGSHTSVCPACGRQTDPEWEAEQMLT